MRRRWMVLAAAGACVIAYGLHCPDTQRFKIEYRGTPPQAPKTFTLHEEWEPQRRILFLSQRWRGIMLGFSPILEQRRRTLRADPNGLSAEVNLERIFSLGDYVLAGAELESDFDASQPGALAWAFNSSGARRSHVEGGIAHTDYHFLDVAASETTFRVPLRWWATREAKITIDFDPILYTSFLDLPSHPEWEQEGNRCGPNTVAYLLSPGVPRTLRYESFTMPRMRPGQSRPRAAGAAEVFVLDSRNSVDPSNERPTSADWAELKSKARHLDGLRIVHDPDRQTVTLEVTRPPAKDEPLARREALVVIGTPSDGRFFGVDCVRLQIEDRDSFNPIVYTVFEGLPGRGETRMTAWGTNCTSAESARVHVAPGKATTLRYRTTVRQWSADPAVGQPIPEPRGDADAFLIKVEDLANLSERLDDGEWDALRKKAVRPAGVTLAHRPGEKSIALRLPDPAPADLALVVGTRSADHRFFGIDCARIDPTPAPPTLYTVLDGLGGRDRMRWSDEGTLCSDPKLPRLEVEARTPVTVHYHTTVRSGAARPEAGSLPLTWGGDADVFLVRVADLAKLSERVDDDSWDTLREKAVQPEGVKLDHSPESKAITLWFRDAAPADLALVVGTRSAGRGAFGFDCVRIDPRRASER